MNVIRHCMDKTCGMQQPGAYIPTPHIHNNCYNLLSHVGNLNIINATSKDILTVRRASIYLQTRGYGVKIAWHSLKKVCIAWYPL